MLPNARYETDETRDKERLVSSWSSSRPSADTDLDPRDRDLENGRDKSLERDRDNSEGYTILQKTLLQHKVQQHNREREQREREQKEREQQRHQQHQQPQSSIPHVLSFQLSQQQQQQHIIYSNPHLFQQSSSHSPISPHYPHSSLTSTDGALDLKDVKDIKILKTLADADRSNDDDKTSISPPHDKSQFSPPSDGKPMIPWSCFWRQVSITGSRIWRYVHTAEVTYLTVSPCSGGHIPDGKSMQWRSHTWR